MYKVLSSLEGLYSRAQYLEKKDRLEKYKNNSNRVWKKIECKNWEARKDKQ